MTVAANPSNESVRESFLGDEETSTCARSKACSVNVGPQERAVSAAAGAAMLLIGLTRGPFRGFMLSALAQACSTEAFQATARCIERSR
ncbi:MAG: hypothetical protein QM775_01330 [Pirellulales bacterium]